MVEVDCPADDCDYSGEVSSVEGHISGSTDGWHSGRQGRQFRDVLESRVGHGSATSEQIERPTVDEEADVEGDDVTGEDTTEEAEKQEEEADENVESASVGQTTSVATAGAAAGAGLLGMEDFDVSPAMVIGVVAILVIGYALLSSPTSGQGGADVDEMLEDTQDSEETGSRAAGGLTG